MPAALALGVALGAGYWLLELIGSHAHAVPVWLWLLLAAHIPAGMTSTGQKAARANTAIRVGIETHLAIWGVYPTADPARCECARPRTGARRLVAALAGPVLTQAHVRLAA